jgi:3-phenylpropionate/trans-cinnamate dioxygenase ferredoxin subunit
MTETKVVAKRSEIAPGTMKEVQAFGEAIVIANCGGEFFAFSDECTHAGGKLSWGELEEKTVECPLHGAVFDVASGKPLEGPAITAVATFRVKIEEDDIVIEKK